VKELEDACDKLLYQHANAILDLRDKKELFELELSIMETKVLRIKEEKDAGKS